MSNIEHFPTVEMLHYVAVKTKELTPKQILSVTCPTCGASTQEPCELHTGDLRTEPHRDRKLSAAEAMETKPANDNRRRASRTLFHANYSAS
jgi:hypothetical protein